jgi:hypothetical protein
MANNIRKPPRENGSTSLSTQRSSLWKRLGRRGSNKPTPSNTKFQQSAPSGSIPLKSSNELYETIPVEPDNGDARSLSAAKRSQRMINNNNNTKNNTTSSKGGGGGGLMRKLKSSFRKSSANSDQNQLQLQQDIDDNDNDEGTMLSDHQRSPLSSQRPPDPSSPAYSTDSFATVEVGKLYNI